MTNEQWKYNQARGLDGGSRSLHRAGRMRGATELAIDAVDNLLRNGRLCPNDTDGDGDCGRPMCPVCGKHPTVSRQRPLPAESDSENHNQRASG
jgi:hypothetical protein